MEAVLGPIEVPTPLVLPRDTSLLSRRKEVVRDPQQARLEAQEVGVRNHIRSKIGERPVRPTKTAGNAYILYRDNNPVGTVCSYYSADIADPASKATNVGQYQGDVHVTVGESYTYTLTTQDNGGVSPVSSTGCANPGVCGTYQIWYMDNGGDAACGLDPDGNALCFVDMSCYGGPTCSTNADCTGGTKCLTQSCCGFSLCATPTTVCANSASRVKRALMGPEKRRAASTRRSDSDACTALSCPSSSS